MAPQVRTRIRAMRREIAGGGQESGPGVQSSAADSSILPSHEQRRVVAEAHGQCSRGGIAQAAP